MHIEDLLRIPALQQGLADHYRIGVRAAIETYPQHAADENTVTGALGQSLAGRGVVELPTGDEIVWITSYTRFRSAGPDSAERRLGGDGVFEIQLTDPDGLTSRKSLVFQSKNRAEGYGDARLRRQARQIGSLPGGGIIINYGPDGFYAVDAHEVAVQESSRLNEGVALGALLGNEFTPCTRGSTAYYYDPFTESIIIPTPRGRIVTRRLPLSHRIRTTVSFFGEREPFL